MDHRRSFRRSTYAVIAAVLVGALLVLLVATRSGGGSAIEPVVERTPVGSVQPVRAAPPSRATLPDPLSAEILSSQSLREALHRYERESVYPPSSHRWSEETAGENVPWNQPFPVEVGLDDRPGQETVVRFAADRHHVELGQALTSTIEVWPAGRPAERIPVTIRSAVVISHGDGRTGIALEYRDDGAGGDAVAGDRVYTNRFLPSDREELTAAMQVKLQVDIEAGGVERLVYLDFTYTPRRLLELVALGTDVKDGSLAIALGFDVHEPGHYLIYADVMAADGTTPIGWITQPWTQLDKGPRRVDVALFGKVLRDRAIPGPYVVANVRAVRRGDELEPEMWWSDPRTFRTEAYPLTAFSAESWDAPERREVIATLERSIREQEATE